MAVFTRQREERARQTRRRLGRFTRAVVSVMSVIALSVTGLITAPAAHAQTADSYDVTTWVQPLNYNVRMFVSGPDLPVPSTVPAGSVITGQQGRAVFANKPANTDIYGWACIDVNNSLCYFLGVTAPGGSFFLWNFTTADNLPADTTVFHFVYYVDDGSTSTIHAAINPPAYLTADRDFTVHYEY